MFIFANGLWKSGTNLLLKACDQAGFGYQQLGIASSLVYGHGRIVRRLLRGSAAADGISVGLEVDAKVSQRWLLRQLALARKSEGSVSGHAAYSDRFRACVHQQGGVCVQVVRDPRAVIDSFVRWIDGASHYFLHDLYRDMSRRQRISTLLTGLEWRGLTIQPFEEVLRRSEGWLANADVVVRYEDLVGPAGGGTEKKQLESLANIRDAVPSWSLSDASKLYGGTHTFSRGSTNGWRDSLERTEIDLIEKSLSAGTLVRWGYEPTI